MLNSQLPLAVRAKAALGAGLFYAGWYPRQWLPSLGSVASVKSVVSARPMATPLRRQIRATGAARAEERAGKQLPNKHALATPARKELAARAAVFRQNADAMKRVSACV